MSAEDKAKDALARRHWFEFQDLIKGIEASENRDDSDNETDVTGDGERGSTLEEQAARAPGGEAEEEPAPEKKTTKKAAKKTAKKEEE